MADKADRQGYNSVNVDAAFVETTEYTEVGLQAQEIPPKKNS